MHRTVHFDVPFDDGPNDVASFFQKVTYGVKLSIVVTLNALQTVASLLDTGTGPNLINKELLPPVWKESVKPIQSPQLRTVNRKVDSTEGIVPLFISIGDLLVRAWFRIVGNPTVDVLLEKSFINRCIRSIFPIKRNVDPWHSRPVANISTKSANILIWADNTVFKGHSHSEDDASSDEANLCLCVRPVTVSPHELKSKQLHLVATMC